MTEQPHIALEGGAVIAVPLNKLKKSPRNARRVPHAEADIEALAASIAVKGVLQAPVVEPETDAEGAPTGCFLVTIGEGRRQALLLLAKRKLIKKTQPVRCVVDLTNDPHEISLDENVTHSAMHPADEFEAFRRLAQERGLGAEEIGARFGVSPGTVRQRLRLGAVSPALMALYRKGDLNLDQVIAFAVSDDHARQEQVLKQMGDHRPPYLIRRLMTEAKVPANDRRAIFIGVEAYSEAGGTILRDLFTEDGGGWFEDVSLLDRLAREKLAEIAQQVRDQEGWKWAEARLDYPRADGLARAYPHEVERSEAEAARVAALSDEYDTLISEWDGTETLPPEVEARFAEIDAALSAFGDATTYAPDDIARGGVFVLLGHDGVARVERGFIRPDDMPVQGTEPKSEAPVEDQTGDDPRSEAEEEIEEDAATPLSERLVLELTAHRTAAIRDALGACPNVALSAVVHALAAATFYPTGGRVSCLEIKPTSAYLDVHAPGIAYTRAGRSLGDRHERWASRLPREPADLWAFIRGLSGAELLDLLAHCASLTINAVRMTWDRRPNALALSDRLAEAVGLDMSAYWTPTVTSYLGRVTKAQIAEAVTEAVSTEAAARLDGLKKPDMASAAEALLVETGWVPALLRRPEPDGGEPQPSVAPPSQDAA